MTDDYKKVFAEADPKWGPVTVRREKGCRMSVIESTWEGWDIWLVALQSNSNQTL